jgi:type II secretory pathway component GspD/PulD (secretin)
LGSVKTRFKPFISVVWCGAFAYLVGFCCGAFGQAPATSPPPPVGAGSSSWAFADVRLVDLTRFALSQALGLSFIADDALLNDQRRVSVDLKPAQAGNVLQVLSSLLEDAGYIVTDLSGVIKIRKSEGVQSELQTIIYRPKHRAASYLIDALGLGANSRQGAYGGQGAGTSTNTATSAGGINAASVNNDNRQESGSASQYIDRSTDVVVVKQSKIESEQTRRALEILDQPAEQVDIAANVYEYTSGDKSGSAIGAVLNIAKGKLRASIGPVEAIGDLIRFDSQALTVLLSALDEDSRFSLISSPSVRAKSGARSRVNVGSDVPTLASTTQGNGQSTQSVAYQRTGVSLDVSPVVLLDSIELNVRQAITEAVVTNTGVNNTPTLKNREVLTQVVLLSGESILLGGLRSSKQNTTRRGVAFLPRFTDSERKDAETTEVLVFLTVRRVK